MTKLIRLSLLGAGGHMEILSRRPLRQTGLRGAYAYLTGQDSKYFDVTGSTTIGGSGTLDELVALLGNGLNSLGTNPALIAGGRFEVVLGAANAYTGIMRCNSSLSIGQGKEAFQSYTAAWVTQRWGLHPADFIVSSARLAIDGDNLVTCVSRSLMEALTAFCTATRLRFTKCLPAVIEPLTLLPDGRQADFAAGRHILIMAEPAIGIAQFVLVIDSVPASVQRFHLGTDEPAELDQIARRVAAQHGIEAELPLRIVQWPKIDAGTTV